MNIGNLKGSGGIERNERTVRLQPQRAGAGRAEPRDEAAISSGGQSAAAAVENLAARANHDEAGRAAKVEAAALRLQSGQLQAIDVLRDIARNLIDADFVAG